MDTQNSNSAQGGEVERQPLSNEWRGRVDEIMDHFDFANIRHVMELVGWKWQFKDTMRVPVESELRTLARDLLVRAIGFGDSGFSKSGGFSARRYGQMVELSFEIESHDSGEVGEQGGETQFTASNTSR